MTQTIRERLVLAAQDAVQQDYDNGHIENWPEVIDAILAELRVPDEAMLGVAEAMMPITTMPGGRFPSQALRFTAMIDAVRDGK